MHGPFDRCSATGLAVLSCVWISGCAATVSVTPKLSERVANCQIHAAVHFDGNPDYLPAALVSDASGQSATAFRYSFEAQYGLKEYNAFLVAANPLSLVGFPTGNDNLVVTGRIEVVRGESVLRTYAAVSAMKRTPTIFGEGETFTAMRRRGLTLVRENLSTQLCQDQALLKKLLTEPDTASQNPT